MKDPPRSDFVPARATLLLVGTDPMGLALADALLRRGYVVERTLADTAVGAALVLAPGAIVLFGDAAGAASASVLARLSASVATSALPVLVVAADLALEARLGALRNGATRVLARSASVDAMANSISDALDRLAEPSENRVSGASTVDELIEFVARRLRAGVISLAPAGSTDESVRIVLRDDRTIAHAIEQLVGEVRPLLEREEPLRLELDEASGLHRLDDEAFEARETSEIWSGRRVALMERSPFVADEIAQTLRAHGAHVVVIDESGVGVDRARTIDPDLVLVEENGFGGWARDALHAIRHDSRLRWASLVAFRSPDAASPIIDVAALSRAIKPLIELDRSLATRARGAEAFDIPIEGLGPIRMLRALANSGKTLHVSVRHAEREFELDLAERLLVGASLRSDGGERAEGAAALGAFLELSTGAARITFQEQPSRANLMAPIDDAIALVDREYPPRIMASSLPPQLATERSGVGVDPQQLYAQLEEVLKTLRSVVPAPPTPTPMVGNREARVADELALSEELTSPRPDGVVQALTDEPRLPPEPAPQMATASRPHGIPAPKLSLPQRIAAPAERATSRGRAPDHPQKKPADAVRTIPWVPAVEFPTLALPRVGMALVVLSMLGIAALASASLESSPTNEIAKSSLAEGRESPTSEVAESLRVDVRESPTTAVREPGVLAVRESPVVGAQQLRAIEVATTAVEEASVGGELGAADSRGSESNDLRSSGLVSNGLASNGPESSAAQRGAESDDGIEDGSEADHSESDVPTEGRSELARVVAAANYDRNRGRLESAQHLYRRALGIAPTNARALAGMVRLQLARSDAAAAIGWAQRLVRAHSAQPRNYVLLGDCYRAAHNREAARRAWQRALQLNPGDRSARARLAR